MKPILIFFCLLFISLHGFGADFSMNSKVSLGSAGIGSVIAIVASWSRNKSVLWALWHAFCGWLYVIYYVVTR